MLFIDTHIVIWLSSGKYENIAKKALEKINLAQKDSLLYISPMVKLELEYLHEIGRLTRSSNWIIEHLKHSINLQIYNEDFLYIIDSSLEISWTRDSFDRIIVGTAICENAPLITKDRLILENYGKAIWS